MPLAHSLNVARDCSHAMECDSQSGTYSKDSKTCRARAFHPDNGGYSHSRLLCIQTKKYNKRSTTIQTLSFLHARKSCQLVERKTTKTCTDHIQSHARTAKDWNMLLGFHMVLQRCTKKSNCFYSYCERCAERVQLRDGMWSQKCYSKCDMGEYHPYFDTTPDYLNISAGAAGVKGTTKGHCFLMGVFLS